MGVKLDWQIETDRSAARPGEDPALRRRRRNQRLRLVLLTAVLAAIVLGGIGAVAWRVDRVDNILKQSLQATVRAETETLKIGDLPGFLALMRGGSADWVPSQSARFQRYQALKQQGAIQFLDPIVDLAVDEQRGRAVVAEMVNGVRNYAVWYYWRYQDGWRHVPADFTFWGDPDSINTESVTVQYRALDRDLAGALAPRTARWWTDACALIGCGQAPHLTISIAPEPGAPPRWVDDAPLELQVGTPLGIGDRTPIDPIIPPALEEAIALKLAEKLVDVSTANLATNPNSDATWLRQSVVEWLTAVMLGRGDMTQVGFIESIRAKYGTPAISAIIHALGTNSDISIVAQVLQQPLNTLALDWRSFFQWRLALEREFIRSNNQRDFTALWDSSGIALANARQRLAEPAASLPIVQSVTVQSDVAQVQAQVDQRSVTLQFRYVNGSWKRYA